jgi:acyl-coenzyme A synthetase/AMP-(fatty) acid ligase
VRYYRTGDVCSYDGDGNVLFRGRNDDEVKLAGRRIHLGEIRQIALSSPGVDRAAVALVQRDGRDLIALVVMAEARQVLAEVEALLANLLPEYMRPTLVAWSPSLTVSSTGKTDEGRLMLRLAGAVRGSSATHFALSAHGEFEPVDAMGDD